MSIITTRTQRRQLERESAKQPARMTPVPREDWPASFSPPGLVAVWRSREFLAQLYDHEALRRLSVLRTSIKGDRWADGITWDELQRVKSECGFGDVDAVEVYPADRDVVNVGNLRHLWLMEAPLPFAWRRAEARG